MKEKKMPLSQEEALRAENEFLKMKLMLESGAVFGGGDPSHQIPAEVENEFLNNIIEFEKHAMNPVYIKLFDKIGQPDHFKPAIEIPDSEIDDAWGQLKDFLNEHFIELSACSPNIKSRDLYRFTLEELFELDIEDIDIEGMVHSFIYDEFYPDHQYDNTERAVSDCIEPILNSEPFEWMDGFVIAGIRLNQLKDLSNDDFKRRVDKFKKRYIELDVRFVEPDRCVVNEWESVVEGRYSVFAATLSAGRLLTGKWKVLFEKEKDSNVWLVREVDLEGIDF